jgi:mannose-6-phosphate isomerase-like protein (cupin superfamily)
MTSTTITDPAADDLVTLCRAGEGPATWALGSLFEQLVTADRTAGTFGATLVTQPPGLATPTHIHTRESEAWFILDGTITYRAGTELLDLAAGDFIYLPRNLPHAFRITGRTPARYVALTVPGGLMDMYDVVGEPAPQRRLPDGGIPAADVARWMELAPAYGLRVVGPPPPDPTVANPTVPDPTRPAPRTEP